MKLIVKTNLENSVYTAEFDYTSSPLFDELVKDFGKDAVKFNVGGDLTKTVTTTTIVKVPELDENDEPVIVDGVPSMVDETVETQTEVVVHKQGDKFLTIADLPFTRSFSDNMLGGKAKEIAELFIANVEKNISDAVGILKGKTDDFSGEKEIQL